MRPDGIEAPIGPVLGAPRRSRDRAQIAVVAAVAVVVLAAGIGLAGNGFSSPPASPSPSAVPSTSVGPTAVAAPTASPLPPPTPNTGLGCSPVRLGAPPEIRLGVDADDPLAIRGVAPGSDQGGSPSQAPAWPVLPVEGALTMGGRASLHLISDQDACMRYVVAEYVPGDPGVSVPFPISFRTLNVNPPRSIVPLGRLPSGDWIVRVVAYFSTGTAGQEDGTVMERFFRVINSDTAGPLPTPATPPAVPCAGPPAGGVPPTLVLSGSGGVLVEGTPDFGAPLIVPPVAPVRLGDSIEIRVAGDACAIAWTIEATQPDVNSNRYEIEREPNAGNNPFLFAQNRWRLHDLPTGNLFVTATIRFSVDVLVTSRWLLDVQGGAVPVARIVAPDGTTVAALRSDCGASWVFEEGTGGYEVCETEPIPSPLITLRVAPETPLRIEVPGWKITNWGGSCGRSDETNNPAQPFLIVDGCDLGGRYLSEGSSAQEPAVPAVFLPRSTGPLVSLYLTVQRDGVTVSFGVWALIETTS